MTPTAVSEIGVRSTSRAVVRALPTCAEVRIMATPEPADRTPGPGRKAARLEAVVTDAAEVEPDEAIITVAERVLADAWRRTRASRADQEGT